MKPAKVVFRCAMLAAGVILGGRAVFAQDHNDLPVAKMSQACLKYLNAYASFSEIQKLEKRLKTQVETKVADQNIDEDTAMRHIMLDWASGNSKKLKNKERGAVKQACFYFVRFNERGYDVPGQIRKAFTAETSRELIAWLETEAGKVHQLAAK